LTPDEARSTLIEALQQVDFINLGKVFYALTAEGKKWGKFNNAHWLPDYERAWFDRTWLAENAGLIKEALEVLKKDK
jgi:hypothetical protein